jgi:hypothetical protein
VVPLLPSESRRTRVDAITTLGYSPAAKVDTAEPHEGTAGTI